MSALLAPPLSLLFLLLGLLLTAYLHCCCFCSPPLFCLSPHRAPAFSAAHSPRTLPLALKSLCNSARPTISGLWDGVEMWTGGAITSGGSKGPRPGAGIESSPHLLE